MGFFVGHRGHPRLRGGQAPVTERGGLGTAEGRSCVFGKPCFSKRAFASGIALIHRLLYVTFPKPTDEIPYLTIEDGKKPEVTKKARKVGENAQHLAKIERFLQFFVIIIARS